jgi:hypothetical protein
MVSGTEECRPSWRKGEQFDMHDEHDDLDTLTEQSCLLRTCLRYTVCIQHTPGARTTTMCYTLWTMNFTGRTISRDTYLYGWLFQGPELASIIKETVTCSLNLPPKGEAAEID